MTKMIAFTFVALTMNVYASHCPSPTSLPEEVETFAYKTISKLCPQTVLENDVSFGDLTYQSWDMSQTFDFEVELGSTNLRMIIQRNDCRFPQELRLEYYDINGSCQ